MFRIGRRRCAAGLIFLAACTGFSADPAPAGQPGDPAGADGGSQGAVDGKGVVATIALKVEAGKKTWVRNRANSVKFTLVRGENARGRVAVAVRGLPTGSTVTAATLEDGVTTGT